MCAVKSERQKNAIQPEPHHSVVSCEYISVALNAPQTGETGRSASYVTWSKSVNQTALKNIRRRGHGPDTRHAENGRTLLTKRLADRNRARQSQYPAFRTLTNFGEGTSVNHHRGRRTFVEVA